jgi:hypothetical protein
MPDLVKVARKPENRGVDVLLVSYDLQVPKVDRDSALERTAKFARARGWGFPVVVWSERNLDLINERLDLPGPIPLSLAFDKEGREVGRCEGEAGVETFDELFAQARGR